MDELQVSVSHYGDRELLEECLNSLDYHLPGVPVHVLDGRYGNFEGGTDLTPGTEDLCSHYRSVHYHSPPEDRLPFGEGSTGRYPIHLKARWINYEVLDGSRWTLKVDADERLREFSASLDGLDREVKYTVDIVTEGEHYKNARLWVPDNWTFYVGDILLPRDEFPRDTSFEDLREAAGPETTWTRVSDDLRDLVRLENVGNTRDPSYVASRKKQIRTFGEGP